MTMKTLKMGWNCRTKCPSLSLYLFGLKGLRVSMNFRYKFRRLLPSPEKWWLFWWNILPLEYGTEMNLLKHFNVFYPPVRDWSWTVGCGTRSEGLVTMGLSLALKQRLQTLSRTHRNPKLCTPRRWEIRWSSWSVICIIRTLEFIIHDHTW